MWSRGALRPMPPQLMGVPTDLDALEASGLVSPAGIARAREDLTAPATPLHEDVTVAEAISRRLGDEVLERLVDPLVARHQRRRHPVAEPRRGGAAARRGRPRHRSRQPRRGLPGPHRGRAAPSRRPSSRHRRPAWGGWPRPWSRDCPPRTSGPGGAVLAVEPDGDRWRVEVSDGTSIEADGVVLATPAAATAGLLAPLPGAAEAATLLAGVEYASVAIAVLAFPLAHLGRPLDRSGFLVPRVEGTAAHGLLVVEHQVGPPRTRRRRRHRRGAGLDRSVGRRRRAGPGRRRPRQPPPDRPRADDGDHRRAVGGAGQPVAHVVPPVRARPPRPHRRGRAGAPRRHRARPGPPCGAWACRPASGAAARPRPACSWRTRRPGEPRTSGSSPHRVALAGGGSAAGGLAPPVGVLAARLPGPGPAGPPHRRSSGRLALRPGLDGRLRTAGPDDVLDAGPHRAGLRLRGRLLRRRHRRRRPRCARRGRVATSPSRSPGCWPRPSAAHGPSAGCRCRSWRSGRWAARWPRSPVSAARC